MPTSSTNVRVPPGTFVWDARAKQYRGAGGRFVSRAEVRRVLDQAIAARGQRMTALGIALREGKISGESWAVEMRQLVKDVHLYNAAAAKGGWAQLTRADLGRVGQIVRSQYVYLNKFAGQISAGLTLDGRFIGRVQLYAEAARRTFYAFLSVVMRDKGYTEERNILHPAEHCDGCVGETARGWVDIGELIPVGERDCLGRCKCTIEYR